jgi:hypothetical protein
MFGSGFGYNDLRRCWGFCDISLKCIIKDDALVFCCGVGHVGSITTLVNDVFCGGTILAFEVSVMM